MKTQKITRMAQAGLAGLLMLAGTEGKTADILASEGIAGRAKIEYNDKGNDTQRYVSTLALDKAGAYEQVPTALSAQFSEFFRLYQVDEFSPKRDVNYTAAGIATPSFKLGNAENKVLASANFGDRQGFLGEAQTMFTKDFGVIVGGERSDTLDSSRISGQMLVNVSPFDFNLGYDLVKTPQGDLSQVFARGVWNINGKDYAGLAGAARVQGDYSQNYVGGFYLHAGKDTEFGLRACGQAYVDNQDNSTYLGQVIFTPGKTTMGAGGARMLLGNTALEAGFGPYLGDSELLVTRSPKELIPLYLRPAMDHNGLAFSANLKRIEKGETSAGYYSAGAAYMLHVGKWMIGAAADVSYNYLANKKDYVSASPALFVRSPNGKLEGYVNATMPFMGNALGKKENGTRPPTVFTVGVQYSF